MLIETCEDLLEQEVWHNNKNDSPREEQAALVIPEQSPVCEAISGMVLGAPVVVLHLMGAKGCFVQHHSRIVERYDHMAVTGQSTLPLPERQPICFVPCFCTISNTRRCQHSFLTS